MKKTLLIVAAAVVLVLTGCAEMGLDGSILERIEDIENRLDEVETLVNADKNGLTITTVQEVAEGYLIIFSDGSSVTVKHGKDGADGKDGQDGEDGEDGENGSAGENGSNGSCIITSVEIGTDSVTFNLSDGRVVVIPLQEGAVTPVNPSLSISFDYSHIDVVMPYQEYSIPYTVESKSDYVNVEAFSSNSYFMVVTTIPDEEDNKKGTINFLLLEDMSDLLGDTEIEADLLESIALKSRITVLATDGKSVIMEAIKLENGVLCGPNYDARQIIVEGEGGVIQLPFFTNVKCDVKFYNQDDYNEEEADWLTLVEDTKAIEEKTLNVQVAKNNTGVARRARVWIYSGNIEEDTEFGISYYIYQNASTEDVAVNEITWTVGYEGGYFYGYELPFELVSYGGYMSYEESCNWLNCYLYGYDGQFEYINVDYNDTNDERTATITIQEDSYRYEYSDEYGEVVSREVEVTTNIITVVQRPSIVKATVAEFLAAAEDETIYELTGEITRVVNTTYGNFDITDETGTVYVYGLLSPEGESKVQWAAAGLKEGDIITIQGTRSSYNGTAQMKNAIYVSHSVVEDGRNFTENSAWTIEYIGDYTDEWSGDTYLNCVNVTSTDNNTYYVDYFTPEQWESVKTDMYGYVEGLVAQLKAYLAQINAQYEAAGYPPFTFADLFLSSGGLASLGELDPGQYIAVAWGITADGDVSRLYAKSAPFEVVEEEATPAYAAWLGNWTVTGPGSTYSAEAGTYVAGEVSFDITITKKVNNESFLVDGWNGVTGLPFVAPYDAEYDAFDIQGQILAENVELSDGSIASQIILGGVLGNSVYVEAFAYAIHAEGGSVVVAPYKYDIGEAELFSFPEIIHFVAFEGESGLYYFSDILSGTSMAMTKIETRAAAPAKNAGMFQGKKINTKVETTPYEFYKPGSDKFTSFSLK